MGLFRGRPPQRAQRRHGPHLQPTPFGVSFQLQRHCVNTENCKRKILIMIRHGLWRNERWKQGSGMSRLLKVTLVAELAKQKRNNQMVKTCCSGKTVAKMRHNPEPTRRGSRWRQQCPGRMPLRCACRALLVRRHSIGQPAWRHCRAGRQRCCPRPKGCDGVPQARVGCQGPGVLGGAQGAGVEVWRDCVDGVLGAQLHGQGQPRGKRLWHSGVAKKAR